MADVRIYEAGPNDLTLEVAQGALSVSKRLTNGRAVTTVREGRNEVRLSFDRAQFVINDGRGELVIAAGSTDGARQMQARVGQSALVRRGADLDRPRQSADELTARAPAAEHARAPAADGRRHHRP
jgi:hypothetical protein